MMEQYKCGLRLFNKDGEWFMVSHLMRLMQQSNFTNSSNKQMTLKIPKQTLPTGKEKSLVTSKEEVTVPSLKPTTLLLPMIACRRRT